MGHVEFDRVSFAYASGTTVLVEARFRLMPGVSALVGENGAGKSTLLRLLTGELRPDRGVVRIEPHGARVVHVSESLETPSALVWSFASSSDNEAHRLRGQLALNPDDVVRWLELSPGQRRRFELGAALCERPDVLLLDEPSNHVDDHARQLLIEALRGYRGIALLVSHDRTLLDALAQRTLSLSRGQLRVFDGNYSALREQLGREREALLHERETRDHEARRQTQLLARARRTQAAAERSLSLGKHKHAPRDHDARSMGRKIVASWAEARHGRMVAVQREVAERAQAHARALFVDKPLGRSLHAAFVPCARAEIARLDVPLFGFTERVLLRELHVAVARAARIRLEGENGSGKSTLLRALHHAARERERVLYLPQELTHGDAIRMLSELCALGREPRGRVLDVVAALGVDPDRLLQSRAPSAGETRKLALALGLGRGAHALFLDEPTNDLDLPSVERLEALLENYPGALLVITHDPAFAERTLSERWCIDAQRLQLLAR